MASVPWAQFKLLRFLKEHPSWNRWLFQHIHVSLPINLVLTTATWFTFTYVNILSMKKSSSRRENIRLPSLLSSLQSQHQDAGTYQRGHFRFPWNPSEVLLTKSFFWEQITSLSSQTLLNFWGRMEHNTPETSQTLLFLFSCSFWFASP